MQESAEWMRGYQSSENTNVGMSNALLERELERAKTTPIRGYRPTSEWSRGYCQNLADRLADWPTS